MLHCYVYIDIDDYEKYSYATIYARRMVTKETTFDNRILDHTSTWWWQAHRTTEGLS